MCIQEKIKGTVASILINVISSDVSEKKSSVVDRIRFHKLKKSIQNQMKSFFKKHDGSFVTNTRFEEYLGNFKIVEKIQEYIVNSQKGNESKEIFLNKLVLECKEYFVSMNFTILVQDELILKDFLIKIYDILNKYYSVHLTENERYQVAENKRSTAEMKSIIENCENRNVERCNEIKRLIENKNTIEGYDVIWSIYETLSKEVWSGKLEEVYNLLPIIHKKNDDIENGIKIQLNVLSCFSCCSTDMLELWEKIEHDYISNDIARILVLFWQKDKKALRDFKGRIENTELSRIVEDLIEEKWDNFFTLEVNMENHIYMFNYKIEEKYINESWLVRRLILENIYGMALTNSVEVMKKLAQDDINFVDKLLISNKYEQYLEMYEVDSEIQQNGLKKLENDLKASQKKYIKSNERIQLLFYTTLLKAMRAVNSEGIIDEINKFPEEIRTNPKIEAFWYHEKIKLKEVSPEQIIQFCMQKEQYGVLNYYLTQLPASQIITTMNGCLILLRKNVQLFFIYLDALVKIEGEEKAYLQLTDFEELYSGYLEYWIKFYRLSKEKNSNR